MSISKDLYLKFNDIISTQEESSKELRKKISNYQQIVTGGNSNTIKIETEIDGDIRKYKDLLSKLEDAYSNRNAPSQIPAIELDRRQKEIQKLGINIQDIENSYKNVQNQKYSFKGQMPDNYQQTDEMKNMSNSELMQLQKEKIDQQDKVIDDVILDVKKGRVLAKEAAHIIDDQNKQLDDLQEYIDKLDSRMPRGIKRFENYVTKQSGCCLILTLIAEFVIAILIFILLSD